MTVTAVTRDRTNHSMRLEAEFAATPERVWQLWADPRQLERWWGPPTYPATFEELDLRPGGRASYYMTGPSGDTPRAGWVVVDTDPPHSILINDHFADQTGAPDPDFPTVEMRVSIDDIGGGRSRMTILSQFPSLEALEKMLAMGLEEGLTEAVGQIDAILAETAPA
jgi:uncharacterized protein YndB with AHSA1/START domain